MSISKRFVVKKDTKTNVITYMEYNKLMGLSFKPKKKISFDDMINVNEIVVINPSLINKLISKKCNRTFEKILKMIDIVSDDEDDSGYTLILDEIDRLKKLATNKYKEYMDEKEYKILLKKVEVLEQEVKQRKNRMLSFQAEQESKKDKSSR